MNKERLVSNDTSISKMNDCVQVNLRITTNSNQGGRKYMEDAYAIALQRSNQLEKESPICLAYFGIFDGHGGKEAAEFARQHLCRHILDQDEFWSNSPDENENDQMILEAIRKGFLACHNDMWNHVAKWAKTTSGLPSTSGSTASVAFIRGNKLYIGHVGDSAIVLGEGESTYTCWKANRLTRDHKPEDPSELKRIRESGGNVLCKAGVHRVVWNRQKSNSHSSYQYRHRHSTSSSTTTSTATSTLATTEYEQIPFLAVSRALGDLWSLNSQTNLYSVSPEPDLAVIDIDSTKHRCLILASDGLWNMINPEMAVEMTRQCDLKTEEMILKSNDDDYRAFCNPSHELVQKALVAWRERMLRSDNITCITVMLDPPGLPFSDCIVQKKKQRLIHSTSSSTASFCSDDTIDLEQFSPTISSSATSSIVTTTKKIKPSLLRKEHILIPISNGPSPTRTPKRRATEEATNLSMNTSRRKLLKTNQQKENGRNSSSTNTESSESSNSQSASLSSSSACLQTLSSNNDDEHNHIGQSEPTEEESMFPLSNNANEELTQKVQECLQSHLDRFMDEDTIETISCCTGALDKSGDNRVNSHESSIEENIMKSSYSPRKRSNSMMSDQMKKTTITYGQRRKSCSYVLQNCISKKDISDSNQLLKVLAKKKFGSSEISNSETE